MVRLHFTLTPKQAERLREEAAKKEIPISELMRKIIDGYFKGRKS